MGKYRIQLYTTLHTPPSNMPQLWGGGSASPSPSSKYVQNVIIISKLPFLLSSAASKTGELLRLVSSCEQHILGPKARMMDSVEGALLDLIQQGCAYD